MYRHCHLPFLTLIGRLVLVWRYLMERGTAMDIRYHNYSVILQAWHHFMGLKTWCLLWQVVGRASDIRYHNYRANVLAWTPHKTGAEAAAKKWRDLINIHDLDCTHVPNFPTCWLTSRCHATGTLTAVVRCRAINSWAYASVPFRAARPGCLIN